MVIKKEWKVGKLGIVIVIRNIRSGCFNVEIKLIDEDVTPFLWDRLDNLILTRFPCYHRIHINNGLLITLTLKNVQQLEELLLDLVSEYWKSESDYLVRTDVIEHTLQRVYSLLTNN